MFLGDLSPSGFGTVTLGLGKALLDRGLDVRFISQNNFEHLPEPYASRTVDVVTFIQELNSVTGMLDTQEASSVIGELMRGNTKAKTVIGEPWGDWRPQASILLGDYLATRILVAQAPEVFSPERDFHYCPIEGVDLPPSWNNLWQITTPVAMSDFGADQIEKVTGKRPAVAYHGVDTEAFHPATSQNPVILNPPNIQPIRLVNRDMCKAMWAAYFGQRMPKVWLLRTDRHMPRKRYNSMLRAVVPVLARQPSVALIIHCNPWDQGGMLPDTISKIPGMKLLNEEIERKPMCYALFGRDYPQLVLTNAVPMDRSALVSLYNAADVYLSTSAEGFGLCVDPRTPISVEGGMKIMREVDIGDRVLTRDGYRLVVGKVARIATERVAVKASGVPPIVVTPEHPFLALKADGHPLRGMRDRLDQEPVWVRADALQAGDLLAMPRPKWDALLPDRLDLMDYAPDGFQADEEWVWHPMGFSPRTGQRQTIASVGARYGVTKGVAESALRKAYGTESGTRRGSEAGRLASLLREQGVTVPVPMRVRRYVPLNPDLLDLLGWYLAEGSSSGGRGIELDLNLTEAPIVARLADSIERIFGVRAVVSVKKGKNVCRVHASGVALAAFFTAMCGKGARSKRLHPVLMRSAIHLGPLVGAYFQGDGHAGIGGWSVTTASPHLAWQMTEIAAAVGFSLNVGESVRYNDYTPHGGDVYHVGAEGYAGMMLAEWAGLPVQHRGSRKRGQHYLVTEDYIYRPVRRLERVAGGEVMDISVEGTHEFVGGGLLLHNTIAEALSCGVPAVAMDYSAVPEVVGPAGILVRAAGLIDNEYDHAWAAVDEQEFGTRVEYLATHQSKREELGRRGPAHIAAKFRWDDAARVFEGLIRKAVDAA